MVNISEIQGKSEIFYKSLRCDWRRDTIFISLIVAFPRLGERFFVSPLPAARIFGGFHGRDSGQSAYRSLTNAKVLLFRKYAK